MFDIGTIIDLADKLGIIQALKAKLLRQPDKAADKLVLVLDELSKVYTAIEAELVRYLSLHFDPSEGLQEDRATLLTLEGGQLESRVSEARGHCHKISTIYYKYLDSWFHRALNPDEARMLKEVFDDLGNADSGMLFVLDQMVQWLSNEATETLNLVDDNKLDEVNHRIKEARNNVLPARRAISKAMYDMRNLQSEFITISDID